MLQRHKLNKKHRAHERLGNQMKFLSSDMINESDDDRMITTSSLNNSYNFEFPMADLADLDDSMDENMSDAIQGLNRRSKLASPIGVDKLNAVYETTNKYYYNVYHDKTQVSPYKFSVRKDKGTQQSPTKKSNKSNTSKNVSFHFDSSQKDGLTTSESSQQDPIQNVPDTLHTEDVLGSTPNSFPNTHTKKRKFPGVSPPAVKKQKRL